MPDTLFRLDPLVADRSGGRNWGIGGTGGVNKSPLSFSLESWWFRAGSDWPATDGAIEGGVNEPVVGVWPLLASLEVSLASVADFSVLKLAFDRRLIDLRVNRLGAITAGAGSRRICRAADQRKGRREESGPMFVCLVLRGTRRKWFYAIVQLLSRWDKASYGLPRIAAYSFGRAGQRKEVSGNVVGLGKARHVRIGRREGDSY